MEDETEKTKNQILKKVASRIRELQIKRSLEPDVIVIHDDQSLLFEAQNLAALQLLIKRCGLMMEGITLPERIRVHPCRGREIISELREAGVTISDEP